MRSLPLPCLQILSAALLCATTAIAQQTAPAVRIVSPIDEKQLVTLKGSMHGLANAANDRGAAPDEMQIERMHLVLKRSDSQEAALRALISQMHTPGTASYHKWLTPDVFGKQFGPSDEDIAAVETWLSGHGFNVIKVNPGKQTIEFAGSVGQFRNAFHTQIHKYEVNGQTRYANAADPQIPAALAPVVGGFVSLNNFQPNSYLKYLGKAQYNPKTDHATPEWTQGSGYNFVLAPQDYAVQYDLNPLYTAGTNGTGQTIAIINESNINIGLVNSFRSLFSLSANPPQVIIDGNDPGVDGINNPYGPNGASVEAYLDVEWAGAVAPDATVDLVIGGDTALEGGLFLAAEHAVYANVAPVISISFGQCEANLGSSTNGFLYDLWEQAAAQGITVMVSSGDSGSAGCDNDDVEEYAIDGLGVNGFASTPYNVAVGGTDFYYSDYSQGLTAMEGQFATYWNETQSNNTPAVSIKSVIPEQPWNGSQYGLTLATLQNPTPTSTDIEAGSGGASYLYTKPAWQSGTGVPSDGQRDLPDVSLFASNGWNASYYPICAVDGDCQPVASNGFVQISGVGGTSASSPSFAGIMALVNQLYGRQGQADVVIYPLAKQFPAAFHDVTNGTNSVPCETGTGACISVTNPITITDENTGAIVTEGEIGSGTTAEYNATVGYDLATGLGTIDANQLVTNWNKVKFAATTTTLTPSSTSFTHGTAITVSGTVTAASGTPTGNVALMTSSAEPGEQGQGLTPALQGESGTFSLLNGAFNGPVYTLPGGTYNIWGQYGGDTSNAESASTPVSITVSPESSGIYFQAISPTGTVGTAGQAVAATVDYGTQLLLSAQVAPTSWLNTLENCSGTCTDLQFTRPTGTIAFADGGTALNTAVINAEGDAEYNAPYAIGSHSVTASYSGDNSYKASTAAAITFTVGKDTPQIYLGASNQTNDTQLIQVVGGTGQPSVFNVFIENGAQVNSSGRRAAVTAPTGTVSVTGFPSGVPTSGTLSATLDPNTGAVAGVATITVPASTATQNYTVSISYSGDSNYAAVPAETGTVQIVSNGLTASSTTATASGSISPTTSILVTGSVTGAGSKAPTGNVYAYASGSFVAGAALTTGSGDVSSFSIVLNSQNLVQGTNYVTLQYFGDSNYNPSAFTLSSPIINPLADFSLIPSTTIIPVVIGSSGTTAINLASTNGFSGAVSLTCKAASGITCSIPSSATLSSGGIASATLTVNSTSSTAAGNYNVLITGADPTGKYVHTLGIQVVVSSNTGFSLTNSGSLTIAHGATTGNTVTISVTPAGGFTGVVDLSCAVTVSPSGATSPVTCSIPPTVNITGAGAATATLTVGSTATTTQGAYSIQVTGKDAATGKITSTTVESVTVTGLTPTVTVTASPSTITTGQTLTVAVTVTGSGATPTGTLSLSGPLSVSPLGATLTSGGTYSYSLAPGTVNAGTDVLTVSYSGDATYASGSGTATVTVNKLTPTLTVTPSVSSILSNQGLTVTGVLTGTGPSSPTGTVTLTGGGYTSPVTTISAGSYSIAIPAGSLAVGTDALTVNYSGDSIYTTASNSANVTVTQFVKLTPTLTVTPASTSLDTGSSLGVTGTVTGTGATPTGNVVLTSGTYTSGNLALSGTGTYSGTIPAGSLSAGTDTLTATYSGDGTYNAATQTASLTVTQSAFTVAATSPAAIAPGTSASSTVTVASTTGYTGSVTVTCALTASPTGASDLPTCSVGATPISLSSSSTSGTITALVSTTGATSELIYPKVNGPKPDSKTRGWGGLGGGAILAFLVFLAVPARRRSWRSMLGMLMLIAVFGSLAACGGGGSGGGGGGGGGNAGTTAGTYTFTVTGTGNPAQGTGNTATFTVSVN